MLSVAESAFPIRRWSQALNLIRAFLCEAYVHKCLLDQTHSITQSTYTVNSCITLLHLDLHFR